MGGWFDSDKPDPPNLAGANEAGVWADAETLGIRKVRLPTQQSSVKVGRR